MAVAFSWFFPATLQKYWGGSGAFHSIVGSVSLCTCQKPLTQTKTDKRNFSASLSAESEYIRSEHSLQQSSPWHLHAPYQHPPLSFFWAGWRRIQVNFDTCNPTISDSFTRGDYKDTNFPKTRANSLPLFLSIENDDAQTSCVTFGGRGRGVCL